MQKVLCLVFLQGLDISESYFFSLEVWVPSKVALFIWTALLGKILTIDNLRKCSFIITDWCYMCKRNGESMDHSVLHCEVARVLWNESFGRSRISWVPLRVVDVLACWSGLHGNSQVASVWIVIPLCLMWCI